MVDVEVDVVGAPEMPAVVGVLGEVERVVAGMVVVAIGDSVGEAVTVVVVAVDVDVVPVPKIL